MTPHLTEDDLLGHYYGETAPPDADHLAAHLAACAECRASLARLTRLLALVTASADLEPPETFEQEAWHRLAPRLARRPSAWAQPLGLPRRLAWAAAAAGVLLAVLLVAQSWRHAAAPEPAHEAPSTALSNDLLRERVLLADLGEHFERSEMLLIELVNSAHHTPPDMRREQARARELLSANRLYRHAALEVGQPRVASVLEDLERLLVDIAASHETEATGDLDALRRRAESQHLAFKVRVLASEVQDRQRRWAGQSADAPS